MNLTNYEFFDHHTHLLDPKLTHLTEREFVFRFLHGYQDLDPLDQQGIESAYSFGRASDIQQENMANTGLVKVLTNLMAEKYGCEPTVKAVLDFRNQMLDGSEEKLKAYTKELYTEENIIGTVLDSHDPWGDKKHEVFPCPVYRLYNFEDPYFELLPTAKSFDELISEVERQTTDAIKAGFTALKGHLAENYTMACQLISDAEAEKQLPLAQKGDKEALQNVFFAMMRHIMYLAQELDVVIHIHAGSTGFNRPSAALVPNLDPFLFAPFLIADRNFIKTKVAFLHHGYPYTRHAGLMAYSFPNIYVDTSWVLPWNALGYRTSLEDVLGVCPHTKILMGTGQHGLPELAWASSKICKVTLADLLEDQVRMGLLSTKQAETTAVQLLSGNAKRLYHID